MTNLNEIYKCAICDNIVEIIHTGDGELVCCDQPMTLQKENIVDASIEKHVPVIEKTENGFIVAIGAVPHPMTADHYIEWIELLADGNVYRKNLQPGVEPQAEFYISSADSVSARAYCNLHGLWKS